MCFLNIYYPGITTVITLFSDQPFIVRTNSPGAWKLFPMFLLLMTQVSCGFLFSEKISPLEGNNTQSVSFEEGKIWIKAPKMERQGRGDWYVLRARAESGEINFYQLCVQDHRTDLQGWAFFESTRDSNGTIYPTIVQERAVTAGLIIKETVGIMMDRAGLDSAARDGLSLVISGAHDQMNIHIDPAYARAFLSLIDAYQTEAL